MFYLSIHQYFIPMDVTLVTAKNKTPCRGMFSAMFCRLIDSEKYSLTISCLAIILNFSSDCAICRFSLCLIFLHIHSVFAAMQSSLHFWRL